MKRIIVCIGLLFSLALSSSAQTIGKPVVKKQQTVAKKNTQNKATTNRNNTFKAQSKNTTILNNTGSYNAFGNNSAASTLTISDPVIRTLNDRANSPAGIDVPGSGILGMPKLAYGVANGHIIFRNTTSPTIGTSTGSGAVGTGTNAGAVGTGGNAIGVNGKNPYAGPGIYGLPITDEIGTKVTVEGSRPKGIRRKD